MLGRASRDGEDRVGRWRRICAIDRWRVVWVSATKSWGAVARPNGRCSRFKFCLNLRLELEAVDDFLDARGAGRWFEIYMGYFSHVLESAVTFVCCRRRARPPHIGVIDGRVFVLSNDGRCDGIVAPKFAGGGVCLLAWYFLFEYCIGLCRELEGLDYFWRVRGFGRRFVTYMRCFCIVLESAVALVRLTPSNPSEGSITWQVDGVQSYRLGAIAVEPDQGPTGSGVDQRLIPVEPMSIVLNLGISPNSQAIDLTTLLFPADDYVRVYQRKGATSAMDAYSDSNTTTWNWEKPKNSLYDGF
ncbi:hypothetical protein C0995_011331 [Termitomyces sp. Mi166|nr:hypothetical protein C0995_011331 [Termitomyces sp. Mi166\